jgi:hypothetical protein
MALYHLSTRVREQGSVIEFLPQLHNQVRYEYHVGGQMFRGQDTSWCSNSRSSAIGQSIEICYDPQHPETSVASDPKGLLENNLIATALAALIVPSFIVARWAWLARHRPQRLDADNNQVESFAPMK